MWPVIRTDLLHHRDHFARTIAEAVHTAVHGEAAASQHIGVMVDLEPGLILLAVKRSWDEFDVSDLDRLPDPRFADVRETKHANRFRHRRVNGGGAGGWRTD